MTSRRGVQIVVLVMASGLLFSAYLLATTGRPWLFAACSPYLPTSVAYFNAVWHALIGLGLVAVAVRDLEGPRLRDPLLLGLFLTFAGLSLIVGGTNGLISGTVWVGPARRCLEFGAPLSYVIASAGLVAGTVALVGAANVLLTRERGEDD